ncbi:hypothetical protein JCM3775_003864 [Rhodotorula graminis]
MPQPPLPLELVALILEPFRDIKDDGERREIGERIALVCKTWLPLGRDIVWHRVSIKVVADQRLAEGIVAHPSSAAVIRHLTVEPDDLQLPMELEADAEPSGTSAFLDDDVYQAALVKSVEVVEACARLDSLALDFVRASDLFNRLPRARMAAALTRLHLSVTLRADFGGADLIEALGRFTSLKNLELAVCDALDVVVDLSNVVATHKLPVATLKLDILVGDPVKVRLIGDAVHGLFDPGRMQHLTCAGLGAASPSFAWLSRYEYLDTAVLMALYGDDVDSAFTNVVAALYTHPRVRGVLFAYEPYTLPSDTIPPTSPVPLGAFLKALPPQVREYVVQGLTFDDTLGLLESPRVNKPVDDVTVVLNLALPDGDDNERRPCVETVVRRERTEDGASWVSFQSQEQQT